MNTQKIQQVFESTIKPQLGRIHKEEKYLNIVWQLASNSSANAGKGLREAQLTEEVKPATQALNKLVNTGFVEITLPVGDGTLLVDPINNKRELFKKQEMIESYYNRFRRHLAKEEMVKRITSETLHLKSEEELDEWVDSLEGQEDFSEYNNVIFKLLERGVEIKTEQYGPLLWRKMAKYYNISEKTKGLLED